MTIEKMATTAGVWLRSTDSAPTHQGIVISSRMRLARNLTRFRFQSVSSEQEKQQIIQVVQTGLNKIRPEYDFSWFDMKDLSSLERNLLRERHLISPELEESTAPGGLAVSNDESLSIMVNEEDHIRLQALGAGDCLAELSKRLDPLDNALAQHLHYAFDRDFGFITACPTNFGLGVRFSVMLHLPALAMSGNMELIITIVRKINLAVRGLYGESSVASGDFYQISNQTTLGHIEADLLADVEAVIRVIAEEEIATRWEMLDKRRHFVEDLIWRAWGVLTNARIISSEEALRQLSFLRLGLFFNIGPEISAETLNNALVFCQPAHLQFLSKANGVERDVRDILRGCYLRELFTNKLELDK